eukprot:359057-Chlamydomonas_euryale.AAC.3
MDTGNGLRCSKSSSRINADIAENANMAAIAHKLPVHANACMGAPNRGMGASTPGMGAPNRGCGREGAISRRVRAARTESVHIHSCICIICSIKPGFVGLSLNTTLSTHNKTTHTPSPRLRASAGSFPALTGTA